MDVAVGGGPIPSSCEGIGGGHCRTNARWGSIDSTGLVRDETGIVVREKGIMYIWYLWVLAALSLRSAGSVETSGTEFLLQS